MVDELDEMAAEEEVKLVDGSAELIDVDEGTTVEEEELEREVVVWLAPPLSTVTSATNSLHKVDSDSYPELVLRRAPK